MGRLPASSPRQAKTDSTKRFHLLATQHLFEQRLYVIPDLHRILSVGFDRSRQRHSPRLCVIRGHIQSSAHITVDTSEAGLSFF